MSIAGLEYVLKKDEVVPTVSASDLVTRAEWVDESYKRHVRTYVPINRAAEGRDGAMSVQDFERKVIKAVNDALAPRGYLTADYGYGKTSTALHLWKRAEEANLVTVPPFQMLHLMDLLTSTYGWLRYRLSDRPTELTVKLETLYGHVTTKTIEQEAQEKRVSVATLREWVQQGRFILDVQPKDYIEFFEQVTALAIEAGYAGILVLPDEIQNYLEPRIKTQAEPITPLFNLVQLLATRAKILKFGLIMVIPLKEVGVLREMRDDLLHRMRDLSLDLTTVYDDSFAENLWKLFAREFNFTEIADAVIAPETLQSLGEIAARQELSNGPRTVINVFRRMVQRYLADPQTVAPYTPLDLIDDFISGAIAFAANDQIPNTTRRALQNQIVRADQPRFERAIKLAAAFPTNGIPYKLQQRYKVADALESLRMQALGELVVSAGPESEKGVTLFGLHIGVQQSDWLSQTIRDFRRAYGEQHTITKERAIRFFAYLIESEIFKGWKLIEQREGNMAANHSLIFEGHYQSFAVIYPQRRVHVRIFWEDEERKDAMIDGDVAVEFFLTTRSDKAGDIEERRSAHAPAVLDYDSYTVQMQINLMYVRPEGIAQNIKQQLQSVWTPYDLTPLILMNIYALLEEKRAANLIPQREDQMIANAFQPELVDSIRKDLFNAEIGASVGGVAQVRLVEVALELLLKARYPTYETIMRTSNWKSVLDTDYTNALNQVENIYQKRGDVEVEGTKEFISRLMGRRTTSLDSFLKTFGAFLEVNRDWEGRDGTGAVKFTLHPLERKVIDWLKEKGTPQRIANSKLSVRAFDQGAVYREAKALGYRDEEVSVLLTLLNKRELIEVQSYQIREIPSQTIDLDDISRELATLASDLETLLNAYPSHGSLIKLQEEVKRFQGILEGQRQGKPDPTTVTKLGKAIRATKGQLENAAREKQRELSEQYQTLQRAMRPFNQKQIEALNMSVDGGVSYVEQVNTLRAHLRTLASSVKAAVDKTKLSADEMARAFAGDLSYKTLAEAGSELEKLKRLVAEVSEKQTDFEEKYKHFTDWQQLVRSGSDLFELLQQMGNRAAQQSEAFEAIVRDIRGNISSYKIEALPNHRLYSAPINALLQQVRTIRRQLEDDFTSLQNRYFTELTGSRFYLRETVGQPLQYNLSNPEESYRLLYAHVTELCNRICEQLRKKAIEERHSIKNLVYSESVKTLPTDARANLEHEGQQLVGAAEQLVEDVNALAAATQNHLVVQDFPEPNKGSFSDLMQHFGNARSQLGSLSNSLKQLSQQVTDVSLTPDEADLFQKLQEQGSEDPLDIIEWRQGIAFTNEQFWRAVQGLFEKRRIRMGANAVRI